MYRIWVLYLLSLVSVSTYGQGCEVSKDSRGRVVTVCSIYYAQIMPQTSGLGGPSHRELSYLGSEYFGFPVWQEGSINIGSRQIRCNLAYNVMTDELLVRLDNSTTIQKVYPDAFTLSGSRFVADVARGKGSRFYMVLNEGPTRLLKTFKCQLKDSHQNNGYNNSKEEEFDGYFDTQVQYFIKRGDMVPEPVTLTRKAIVDLLGERAETAFSDLPRRKLTEENIIQALKLYDSAMQ